MSDETYLGDGAYCSFDGHTFLLRAPRGPAGTDYIALGPLELAAFFAFVAETIPILAEKKLGEF